MRPGGGGPKGAEFEREICKRLSLWVTNGKMADVFWRSAMSGGRATISRGSVRQAGDIVAVSSEGYDLVDKWFFECKHVKKLQLDQFLVKGTGELARFWSKACREAAKYGQAKRPMVIARQNGWPILSIVEAGNVPLGGLPIIRTHDIDVLSFDQMLETPYAG